MVPDVIKYFILLMTMAIISLWPLLGALQTAVFANCGRTSTAEVSVFPAPGPSRRHPRETICTKPRNHIVYIKIQKTGSGTVKLSILEPYGIKNNLTFFDMYSTKYFHGLNYPNHILPALSIPAIRGHYDMMISESRYKSEVISLLMPRDSFYFFSVRHPVARFLSAFYFTSMDKRIGKILGIWKPLKILKAFLDYPEEMLRLIALQDKAIKPTQIMMVMKNQQLFDLGFEEEDVTSPRLESKIDQVISEFDMVVITEHFNESMILLKRKLCWKLEDILYTKEHLHKHAPVGVADLPQELYDKILEYNPADMILYKKAEKRFREMMKQEKGFEKELRLYKKMLDNLAIGCGNINKLGAEEKGGIKCPKKMRETFKIRQDYRKKQNKKTMAYFLNDLRIKFKLK